MKRFLLMICFVTAAFSVFAAENKKEDITGIEEEKHFEKGEYKAEGKGDTLTVKKGEGFDFKIPEILITGRVDTKVMLKREMRSLENLQEIKTMLYEDERVEMPYSYLKESELGPQGERAENRDFVGRLEVSGGTMYRLYGSGIIGKAFDPDNSLVISARHENHNNPVENDRVTYQNLNSARLFYKTLYYPVKAVFDIRAGIGGYTNPYPENIFTGEYFRKNAEAKALFSAGAGGFDFDAGASYSYLDNFSAGGELIFRERRAAGEINMERDFKIAGQRKVKTIITASIYGSDIFTRGAGSRGIFDLDILLKGIFYFEPFVFQGGLRAQDHSCGENYYRMSPYLRANYDISPKMSVYANFTPQLKPADYMNIMEEPFIAANTDVKPAGEYADFKTGAHALAGNIFFDVFYGYKSVKNNIYLTRPDKNGPVTLRNNDIEYTYTGIRAETIKSGNFSLSAGYTYRNILKSGTPVITYFALNRINAGVSYGAGGWKGELRITGESDRYGSPDKKLGGYFDIDVEISKKINDNVVVSGYINNVLNNNYYLLYYYKEKPINLGLSAVIVF